jgi:ABC-2 type transport system permease protein
MTRGRSRSAALGVARRLLRNALKNPAHALPPLLIPLFFFAAFSGAFAGLGDTKGFGYYNYTAFQFVFILFMATMFVGVFTSFDIANDYETGLGRRFMLAVPRRMAIIVGYVIFGLARAVFTVAVVFGIAVATGMPVRGGAVDIAGMVALALLLNVATTLFGAGISLRLQSAAGGALVLIPVFLLLFLTPVFTPRDNLSGWVKTAAGINPLTPAIEAGRGFLANDPVDVALAFAVCVGLVIAFSGWAVLAMRKAEKSV